MNVKFSMSWDILGGSVGPALLRKGGKLNKVNTEPPLYSLERGKG